MQREEVQGSYRAWFPGHAWCCHFLGTSNGFAQQNCEAGENSLKIAGANWWSMRSNRLVTTALRYQAQDNKRLPNWRLPLDLQKSWSLQMLITTLFWTYGMFHHSTTHHECLQQSPRDLIAYFHLLCILNSNITLF